MLSPQACVLCVGVADNKSVRRTSISYPALCVGLHHFLCRAHDDGDGEPGITYLGITESGITESGITWVMGIRHNRNWYNGISYNIEVECGITESGITESGITRKFDSGIRHNNKRESGITESSITESGIT